MQVKRLLLLLSLQSFYYMSFTQINFITAGQTDSIIFTDYVPDYSIVKNEYVQLDINQDGINDFRIYYSAGSAPHGDSYNYKFSTLGQNMVMAKIDTNRCLSIGGVSCFESPVIVAKKFKYNDTITNTIDSFWIKGYIDIQAGSYVANTQQIRTDYIMPLDSPYYYFVKIIAHSDTLLGYVHFSTRNLLFDFACEGSTSTYIISSITDSPIKPYISVYPNPFSNKINVSTATPIEYQLTDITGRVILSGITEQFIDTRILSLGNYFLVIKNGDFYCSKKLIKVE